MTSGGVEHGKLFRCVCRAGVLWGDGISEKVVWHVVKQFGAAMGLHRLAPHDLRRYAECRIMPNRDQSLLNQV
jgi:hypothetical protein